MAAQQNFRTAFNGFNREDVVRYIEYLNTRHAAELSRLNSDLEYLRSRAAEQPAPAADPIIEEQASRIRELEAEVEALKAAKPTEQISPNSELEAYRRAERVERRAKERAELVYHQVNGTLADATVKVEGAAAMLAEMTDGVVAQLARLQTAVTDSKQALKDAAETMYTLRPEGTEE